MESWHEDWHEVIANGNLTACHLCCRLLAINDTSIFVVPACLIHAE